MGKIQVGQKSPKTIDMGGFTVVPSTSEVKNDAQAAGNAAGKALSAEEKAKLIEEISRLPKEQIVPELRKHGLNEVADITEAQMKQADEEKAQADAREKRLAEIQALPIEEQLPLLLEEGFTDEAQELSERLAAEKAAAENAGEGEKPDTEGAENADGGESGEAATEPEKKKGGRPKKNAAE